MYTCVVMRVWVDCVCMGVQGYVIGMLFDTHTHTHTHHQQDQWLDRGGLHFQRHQSDWNKAQLIKFVKKKQVRHLDWVCTVNLRVHYTG
jgi:hypothetical protein